MGRRDEDACMAHSGMLTKLNIQLFLGGLCLLLLSTLLAVVIDTHAKVTTSGYRFDAIDKELADHSNRIASLERTIK